jgi:hypothetical protein
MRADCVTTVYAYLYNDKRLNLTFIELAKNHDSYVAWMELAPPNKQAALRWLHSSGSSGSGSGSSHSSRGSQRGTPRPADEMPPRHALALLVLGRHDPPRVVQVGPCFGTLIC